MPKFVSLSTIRSLPANLANADGNGMPKRLRFGGWPRHRISSQSLKFAMRQWLIEQNLVTGVRTRLVQGLLADVLVRQGRDPEEAQLVARAALQALGLGVKEGKTQTLLFLGQDQIRQLGLTMHEHEVWTPLLLAAEMGAGEEEPSKKALRSAPGTREAREALAAVLDGGSHAVDRALFGAMVADRHTANVDAALQVSHSFSVDQATLGDDLWIAKDDMVPLGEGAAMLQRAYFSSAAFYGYQCLDTSRLAHNLGDDPVLTRQALEAWLEAAILSLPQGKRNSFSAYTEPALALVQIGDRQPFAHSNAFLKPVRPTSELDLVAAAVDALDEHLCDVNETYFGGQSSWTETALVMGRALPKTGLAKLRMVQLVEGVIAQVFPQ